MNILLDTNVFLWALAQAGRLKGGIIDEIESSANDVFFSAVTVWEVAIKYRLGQPAFSADPEAVLRMARQAGYEELPLTASIAATVARLPPHHRDPFDRLLVAQAIAMPARFYTSDRSLVVYSELVTLVR